MNLGKVEIWETSLDRIVTLREGAKGVLRPVLPEGRTTIDTGGKFVSVVGNLGYHLTRAPILPKLRLIDGRREFATSVTVRFVRNPIRDFPDE